MKAPLARALVALGLGALLAGLAAPRAHAQSIGLEAGLAGVKDHGSPAPSLGVRLAFPFTTRLKASLSYAQWTGAEEGGGYGNRGVSVLGLFRVAGRPRGAHAFVGAGVGWYQMRGTEGDSFYREALTFGSELRMPIAYNTAAYLRGDVSVPSDGTAARWAFLRIGVDVGVF